MINHGIGDLQKVSALALKAGVDMDMVSEGFLTHAEKIFAGRKGYSKNKLMTHAEEFLKQNINWVCLMILIVIAMMKERKTELMSDANRSGCK